jgi:hypothetical protein
MLITLGTFYFAASLFLESLNIIKIKAQKNKIAMSGLAFN